MTNNCTLLVISFSSHLSLVGRNHCQGLRQQLEDNDVVRGLRDWMMLKMEKMGKCISPVDFPEGCKRLFDNWKILFAMQQGFCHTCFPFESVHKDRFL